MSTQLLSDTISQHVVIFWWGGMAPDPLSISMLYMLHECEHRELYAFSPKILPRLQFLLISTPLEIFLDQRLFYPYKLNTATWFHLRLYIAIAIYISQNIVANSMEKPLPVM